jgi:hypothetical protein
MSSIDIPSQSIYQSIEINKIKITLLNHILSQEVLLEILLQPVVPTMPPVVKYIPISGEEYANWGVDDNYLIQLAAQKLNLTLYS